MDHPLHRLYHDKSRYRANRRTAVSICVKYWGKDYATSGPAGPRECDEYPFASTYEGAAQSSKEPSAPKDNFSARGGIRSDSPHRNRCFPCHVSPAGRLVGVGDERQTQIGQLINSASSPSLLLAVCSYMGPQGAGRRSRQQGAQLTNVVVCEVEPCAPVGGSAAGGCGGGRPRGAGGLGGDDRADGPPRPRPSSSETSGPPECVALGASVMALPLVP
ncbi:NucA/NucB deoxyribonuclease domain-containing protein [Streptomyces nigrescens]|uniref:NucA/NucB deoxyribonuclease domain-containing protein n=1 Tax=Streptomyces nigrescens TaxID=1920 RepID=UPI003F4CCC57